MAMVLCDQVYRDAISGKFTILGTFSTVGSDHYPVPVLMHVYFAMTDGHGTIPIGIRIVNAQADMAGDDHAETVIWELPPQDMEFPSPLAVIESVASIKVDIPGPGHYRCELYARDQMLMARRLLAVDPTLMGGLADG